MTDQPEKKGMSQGCKVGLIVGIVLLVLFIAVAVTCWVKKDDLAKFGAITLVDGVKATLAEEPVAALDTAEFNALADAFKQRLTDSELNYEKYQVFFQAIQSIPSDKRIDEDEAWIIVDGMIEYFPELEEMRPQQMMDEGMDDTEDSSDVMEDGDEQESAE